MAVPDANSTEGTEVSTGTTSDATAAEGLDAAGTETQGTESQGGTDANGGSATEGDGTTDGATLGADSGENASEGQLITPTLGDGTAATVEGDTTTEGIASGTEGNDATDAAGGLILFSIVTEPSGAEVTVDGFDLGTTPVSSFPLTPSAEKQLSISLDGYETVEQSFDGTEAQDLFVTLTEASGGTGDVNDVEGDATTVDSITIASDGTVIATDDPSFTPAAELQGKAVITIEDGGEAWLEVYEGTTRSGDPLVYRVANDSDRFEFDMPVVVRAGRSSLVQVSVNGGLAKPLGPPDEVAQQTFDE